MRAGVAFLPIVVAISVSASFASARLLPRTGPRPLVPTGMVLSTMGMVLFTRLTLSSDYVGHVLPGLIVLGLGLGLIFSPAIASATAAVGSRDAGAASALVNTSQQIGGSIGTALLNTIAVTVTMRALAHAKGSVVSASRAATLHGFSVAFWWAAGFFGAGAIISLLMLESGTLAPESDLAPVA
jgi:sugar phosphate permease